MAAAAASSRPRKARTEEAKGTNSGCGSVLGGGRGSVEAFLYTENV